MVSELYQGELSEGASSFDWNTANAPSGAYLALLNAGGSVTFTKLVVTK